MNNIKVLKNMDDNTLHKYNTAVFISRFQVPSLHKAHIKILNMLKKNFNKVIIVVRCPKNIPSLNYTVPYNIILDNINKISKKFIVVPLINNPVNNKWSKDLDQLIKTLTAPIDKVCIIKRDNSIIPSYTTNTYKIFEISLDKQYNNINGTNIRDTITKGAHAYKIGVHKTSFYAGAIWMNKLLNKHPIIKIKLAIIKNQQYIYLNNKALPNIIIQDYNIEDSLNYLFKKITYNNKKLRNNINYEQSFIEYDTEADIQYLTLLYSIDVQLFNFNLKNNSYTTKMNTYQLFNLTIPKDQICIDYIKQKYCYAM